MRSATTWGGDDLAAVSRLAIDGVLLPKVESADAVRQVEAMLDACGAGDRLAIWCMIETPLGVLRVAEIAAASKRIGGLVMGPRTSPTIFARGKRRTACRC